MPDAPAMPPAAAPLPSVPGDVIRAFAIWLVVLLHSAAEPVIWHLPAQDTGRWWAANLYDSLARPAVPLFLLLSGGLLLAPGKSEPLGAFFRKRVARIGAPFLLWAAVYFAWRHVVKGEAVGWSLIWHNTVEGSPYFHFWFLYMLIGLYLATPLLRVLLTHADRNLLRYGAGVWFAGQAIAPLLARWDWVHLGGGLLPLSGFVGYFVLGAILRRDRLDWRIGLGVWLAAFAWTAWATWQGTVAAGGNLEQAWYDYLSINVILAACGLYACLTALPVEELQARWPRVLRLLGAVGRDSFAIYFAHVLVLETLQQGYLGVRLNTVVCHPAYGIPLLASVGLGLTFLGVRLLRLVPGLGTVLG